MHFFIPLLLVVALTLAAPKLMKAIELLIFVPIVGCAFGGFAWAVSSALCNALISFQAFGAFIAVGTALTLFIVAKS